jgi:hypothetical protein
MTSVGGEQSPLIAFGMTNRGSYSKFVLRRQFYEVVIPRALGAGDLLSVA